MQKVAFICVHNSCRSQIAQALGRHLAADVFESYSAGTERKDRINPDAVRLMKELYHIDMEAEGQHSKLLSEIPPVDVVVTMGCNVRCPFLPCSHREDWGLEDPTGKSDEVFLETIRVIAQKVLELKARLQTATGRSLHSSSGNGFGTAVEESGESKYQQRTHALTDREVLAEASSQVMLDDLTEAERDGFLSFTRDYRVQKRRWLSPSANFLLLRRYTGRDSGN